MCGDFGSLVPRSTRWTPTWSPRSAPRARRGGARTSRWRSGRGAGRTSWPALKWGDVDAARGVARIRAGRYRGKEGPPKTASSVRDIDLLPPVAEALKTQKAQQATERLKRG